MFTNDVSSEILIIYGLIGLVIGLIVVVLYLDKKEKKRVNLVQTQELRLMDLRRANDEYIEEFKKTEEIVKETSRVIERVQEVRQDREMRNSNVNLTENASLTDNVSFAGNVTNEDMLEKINIKIDEDMYVEDDLEKTQAQLRLEALTNELKKVQEREIDKIARFEEEQEENAIISYKELLKVCDRLYDSNEKVQYMDEGDEPITISQLRNKFSSNDQVEVL